MKDFQKQIRKFTCVSDETKSKIIANFSDLDEGKQSKIIEILTEGELMKDEKEEKHDKRKLEHVEKYVDQVMEFKRGYVRDTLKNIEENDRTRDEKIADNLLNTI